MIPLAESCPLRFNLDRALLARCVVTKARPRPVSRFFNQSPIDRIPMHITEFFDSLLFVMHTEIVVPPLPELDFAAFFQLARGQLLQHLKRNRQRRLARLTYKQMNVLRHQDISGYDKAVPRTHGLKFKFEYAIRTRPRQQRLPPITTEGQEMKAAALLVSDKFSHHERILHPGQVVEVRGLKSEIGKDSRLRFAVPTLSTIKLWKGWGTQL